MDKYHSFSVLAQCGDDSECVAIVSGLWWGDMTPTATEVRDRIKSAIAPWFITPVGAVAFAKYNSFDLGDLDLYFYPPIEELIRAAGIVDLKIVISEASSDWNFTDSLAPKPNLIQNLPLSP